MAANQRKKKRTPWLWVLLGLLTFGAVLCVALWLALPTLLLRWIEKEARASGVELRDCALSFSLEHVTLDECTFELLDAPHVRGSLGQARVNIKDFEPVDVVVKGARIEVRDLPDSPVDQLRRLESHAELSEDARLPLRIEDSRVELYSSLDPGSSPYLTITHLNVDSQTQEIEADILLAEVISGSFTHKKSRSELNGKLALSPDTTFRVAVDSSPEAAEFRIDFQHLPLGVLNVPLVVQLPPELAAVQADGQVHASVPFGLDAKGVRGDFRTTLTGLPLPIPREVQGLVYGPRVEVRSKFRVHPNNQQVAFHDTLVQAGVLRLKGGGEVEFRDNQLNLQSNLKGSLTCQAILESATKAHTDSPLALEAARLAKQALDGSVDILVALHGNLAKPNEFQVLRTIGVGCGLKPLPLPPEFQKLPKEILKKLPRLPDPEELKLPEPPKLTLPKLPRLRRDKDKKEKRLDDSPPKTP